MKNINVIIYSEFTKEIHGAFMGCATFEELDVQKDRLITKLKRRTNAGRFNADEFLRLRFRISSAYIKRLPDMKPLFMYNDTDSIKVVNK